MLKLIETHMPRRGSPAGHMRLIFEYAGALLRGLGSADSLREHGGDLEQVAADAVVGNLEDGSGVVLVHRNDALRILHTGLVLDGAGNAQGDVHLRVHRLALALEPENSRLQGNVTLLEQINSSHSS